MAHHKLRLALISAVAGLGLTAAGQARGSVIYSYVAETPGYQAAVGSTVRVNLYLQESLSGSDTSFIQGDGGLFSMGAQVFEAAGGSASISGPTVGGKLVGNTSDFGGPTSNSFSSSSAIFNEAINTTAPYVFLDNTANGTAPGYADKIYLGDLIITVGSTPTQFTIGAINDTTPGGFGIGGNTLTANFSDLDTGLQADTVTPIANVQGVNGGTTTFTVSPTPIPEPASLGLFACGGLLALRRRRA